MARGPPGHWDLIRGLCLEIRDPRPVGAWSGGSLGKPAGLEVGPGRGWGRAGGAAVERGLRRPRAWAGVRVSRRPAVPPAPSGRRPLPPCGAGGGGARVAGGAEGGARRRPGREGGRRAGGGPAAPRPLPRPSPHHGAERGGGGGAGPGPPPRAG